MDNKERLVMKSNRRIFPCALALACLLAEPAARLQAQESDAGSPPEGGLCQAGENVVFACSSGRKQIAVCATPGDDSSIGALSYRYGSNRNLEVNIPTEPVPPRAFASGNRVSDNAGGNLTYLRMNYGSTSYTVFSETTSPGGYERNGVLVENRGHTELHECDGQADAGGLSDQKLIGKAVPVDDRVPTGFATYQQ